MLQDADDHLHAGVHKPCVKMVGVLVPKRGAHIINWVGSPCHDIVHACVYVCMYACMFVCMHVCMHVCVYVCWHVCMYMYV